MKALEQIRTKYHVDKYGNPQSIHILRTYQVAPTYNQVLLDELPDEYKGIDVLYPESMYRVYNPDEITEKAYFVNEHNNVVYFHSSMAGKFVKIDYHGIGNELIGADRIYTILDDKGNITETLGDIIEKGKIFIESAKTMTDAIVIVDKLKEGNRQAELIVPRLLGALYEGVPLKESLEDLVEKSKPMIEYLKPLVESGEKVSSELPSAVEEAKKLNDSLANLLNNEDLVHKRDFRKAIENMDENIKNLNKTVSDDLKDEIANIKKQVESAQDNKKDVIIRNEKNIKNLELVKDIPYSNLVCFVPPKTNRYLESLEVIPEKDEIIVGYCNFDESINKIGELQKFDYNTKLSKGFKEVNLLAHCNGLAYYPKENELYVATMDVDHPYELLVLDYDTLNFKRYQTIPGLENTISSVSYNRERDQFVIKTGGSQDIRILDTNFNILKELNIYQDTVFQSITTSGDYIYFVMNNIIKVYNIETEEVTVYKTNAAGENEGASIDKNGNLIIGFCTPGSKFHCETARIFEVDFTARSYHGLLNERHAYWSQPQKNIMPLSQFMYIKKIDGKWISSANDSQLGIYSTCGNNFIKFVDAGSSLQLKYRMGLLYEAHGGIHLNYFAQANWDMLKRGIVPTITWSTSKHVELDFVDVSNKRHIAPSELPDGCGCRVSVTVGIQGL